MRDLLLLHLSAAQLESGRRRGNKCQVSGVLRQRLMWLEPPYLAQAPWQHAAMRASR